MLSAMKRVVGVYVLAVLFAAVCLVATGSAVRAATPPNYPTGAVELTYYQPGPWPVTAHTGFACCDTSGAKFDIWYPTQLGNKGLRHPIITFGNGTNAVPSNYAYLLSHLASWGFVVIATENKNTGTGSDILVAANYLVREESTASSIFFHKLDTSKIGAVGHSQGASGSLNAMMKSGGAIKTAVTLELPAQQWCSSTIKCALDIRKLTSEAVFFVNGSADILISPSTQLLPWQVDGLQSNQAYYQATPATVSKVWGTLNGPNHNDSQGQPDCAAANFPCTNGVYGYLGYPTAWLMDRLRGDARAHSAFISGSGEIFTEKTNWSNQTSNIAH
jgi:hypothetical protein